MTEDVYFDSVVLQFCASQNQQFYSSFMVEKKCYIVVSEIKMMIYQKILTVVF